MPKRLAPSLLLALASLNAQALQQLHGTVCLLGPHNAQECTPASGAEISLRGWGNTVRSSQGGEFSLSLPEGYQAGEDLELIVAYPSYQLFQPPGGRIKVPKDPAKQSETLQLLPNGSKRWWADDQIQALIEAAAAAPKPPPQPNSLPPDLSAYLKDWAKTRGLDEQATLAEIDRWAKHTQASTNDLEKLGLAAFAQKNFRKAEKNYAQAAQDHLRQADTQTQAAIADYRKAGDAAYYDSRYRDALAQYQQALSHAPKDRWPLLWAAVSHDLANAQWALGIRSDGVEGNRLLAEAADTLKQLLARYDRQRNPQDWAMTQNNLGNVLREQGIRTGGEAGARLLGEAVAAFREALQVRTRRDLPQDWAATQNNLGNALGDQGERTGGEAGARLRGEAVAAYREALQVRTRRDLPQDWAATQNNLGTALQEQGIRSGGEAEARLLGEATVAFRSALEVWTRTALPGRWQIAARNLAKTYALNQQWPEAAALYRELYEFDPSDAEAYGTAAYLYHEILFDYPQAYALNQAWLQHHPDDLSAQADFAEKQFTTARYREAQQSLQALLARSDLDANIQAALRALAICAAAALG